MRTMFRIKFNSEKEQKMFISKVIRNRRYYMAIDLMGAEGNDFLVTDRRGLVKNNNVKESIVKCLADCGISSYKIVKE